MLTFIKDGMQMRYAICWNMIENEANSQNICYNFDNSAFLGPLYPNKYAAIFLIWISSLPSVIRYLLWCL